MEKGTLNYRFFGFLILLFVISFESVQGQGYEKEELIRFNQKRIDYNKKGMVILGSWALGNIALGGIMAGRTSGETKALHQMSLYWNTVNLAIAGFGYYSALNEVPSTDFWETIGSQHSIEKILLVNAALDLAYMAGGIYVRERGRRLEKDQLKGFGKSVILQGAFLMVFDGIKYGFHNNHGKELPKIINHLGLTGDGVGLIMMF
jgi:hypothetical protein